MEGFSFVTPVTGHNRPNTGKEDDDDDDLTNAVTSISLSISAAVQDRVEIITR
jgi:hypothetical protein